MSSEAGGESGCLVVLVAVALFGWWMGWWWKSEEWTAYAYPSASDLSRHVVVGTFKDFETCQANAIGYLRALPGGGESGDYECGLNCEANKYGENVCKETRK